MSCSENTFHKFRTSKLPSFGGRGLGGRGNKPKLFHMILFTPTQPSPTKGEGKSRRIFLKYLRETILEGNGLPGRFVLARGFFV
jgi:hypothetical protein